MSVSLSAAEQISFFCFQISNRRFIEDSLRILESILVTKDVKSLIEVRSSLREYMSSEFFCVIREIEEKSVDQKILVLDFFVRAFALIGDIESCLAVRYEALLYRQLKSPSNQWLQVSHTEWLSFADHSIQNGFYTIAWKACENALLCIQRDDGTDPNSDEYSENSKDIEKIKRLKDSAIISASSHSADNAELHFIKKGSLWKSNIDQSII
ncbi:uncharacterized protein LOC110823625 isoform X2 [Carica papaya]|uniref:uncharacterized protein LOC110823625 isoform X2 n=1 Tax=Carica papaya TaxID=3649 RepID=UPI000B8C726C|nr:uncharacterized protein LOC110823625 isoform X2 [Carica papaya]